MIYLLKRKIYRRLINFVICLIFVFKTWERKSGWRVHTSRPECVPGDPGFPRGSDRTLPKHYADRGFSSSPI